MPNLRALKIPRKDCTLFTEHYAAGMRWHNPQDTTTNLQNVLNMQKIPT